MLLVAATETTALAPTSIPWNATTRRKTSGKTCPPCIAVGGPQVSLPSTTVSMQLEDMTQVWTSVLLLWPCTLWSFTLILCSCWSRDCLGQWLCEVERFDPSTSQWCLIAPMHHSRTGVAVTALRGKAVSLSLPSLPSVSLCLCHTDQV